MRLSDKLATAQPREDIETPSAVDRLNRRRSPRDERPGQASWEASKRKVRELVLADMAPKMGHLSGEGLAREVRGSLDGILERSDVTISPLERRKFVQEMIQDTLGYGPLDPLLRDSTVTEIMCNAFNEIWVERAGAIEMVDARFGDD